MIGCIPPILLIMVGATLGWLIGGDYGAFWGGAVGAIIGVITMIMIVFALIKARR